MSLSRSRSDSVQRAWLIILPSLFRRNLPLPQFGAASVKDHRDPAAVRMIINPVRPVTPIERETVARKGGYDLARRDASKTAVVDIHGSDGDRHPRLDGDLRLIGRFLWNALAMRKHALHHDVDDAIEIPQRLGLRGAPG